MAVTLEQFLDNLSSSGLLAADVVAACLDDLPADQQPQDARSLAKVLVRGGKLTKYQAQIIYQGKQNQLKFGEYTVLDKIGEGGMGVVLKARHRRMKRKVAIKVLPVASMQDQEAIDRFYREVEAAAKLMHTNIVTAHDAGEYEGMHYLVMEYVDGEDLSEIIRHHGPLPIQQAVECIIQTARGLEYAHQHGVVHRDIKPANLLLAKDGTVKILDMGLARLSSSVGESLQSERPQLTQSGQMMGTVDYMSPEQARDTRHADHRSDIYSLGCTLYRLLTGDNVYAGRTAMKKLMAHQEKPIPLISDKRADVKPSLDAVFQKMLAKEPQQRQQSMSEVIAELEAAMSPDAPPRRRVRDEPSSDSALTQFFAHIDAAKKVAVVTNQPATGLEETIDCQPEKEDTSNRMIPVDRLAVSVEKPAATMQQPTQVVGNKKLIDRLFQKRIVWAAVGVGVLIMAALLGMLLLTVPRGKSDRNSVLPVIEASGEIVTADFALEFDGKTSYVNIESLKYDGSYPLTIEAMVTPAQGDQFGTVIGDSQSAGLALNAGAEKIHRIAANTAWNFLVHNGHEYIAATTEESMAPDDRVFLAAIYDGQNIKLFVDGRLRAEGQPGAFKQSPFWFTIGANPGPESKQTECHFEGTIDEIRFSNIARYTEDFSPPQPHERFQKDEHTLALYHCDAIQDGRLIDSSGNNHHGTVHNCKLARVGAASPAITSVDVTRAKQYQQSWAEYLGQPVERVIDIPGGEKLVMVLIPPGEFLMGSTPQQQAMFLEAAKAAKNQASISRIPSEDPQHRVRITKPFYLGKYEVTQAQWQSVMGTKPSGFKDNPSHPVEQLSWGDIQPFLAKLNESRLTAKMAFALPTEAQWEYACRAGTTTPYYGGESEDDLLQCGWFHTNSEGKTRPVGELEPNGFGLYDMHGNVWEVCADRFEEGYYAKSPVDNPSGPSADSRRVSRGGGWGNHAGDCRSARWGGNTPDDRNSHLGFRLAAVPVEE